MFELVEENPYITDFYQDMSRWSFHSQIYFLSSHSRQHYELLNSHNSAIQDRSIYEAGEIFARNLYEQGYISEHDWHSYHDLYEVLTNLLPPPNLVVYLQASVSTLKNRIARRGLGIDLVIKQEYLLQLNNLYKDWVSKFNLCPMLTINTDELDFVHNPIHLNQISAKIMDKLLK